MRCCFFGIYYVNSLYLHVSAGLPEPASRHVPVHPLLGSVGDTTAGPQQSLRPAANVTSPHFALEKKNRGKTHCSKERTEKTLASLETINGFSTACGAFVLQRSP